MYPFLRVKKFLLCFKLETGGESLIKEIFQLFFKTKLWTGKIIGWLTLLINLALLCIWVAAIVVLSSTPCHEIEGYVYDEKQELTNFEKYCMIGMTGKVALYYVAKIRITNFLLALGILLKIAVLLSLACAVIGFLCIIGSKQVRGML